MFNIIRWLFLAVFNLLPDSPFASTLDMMEVDSSYLQYLNWFLPLDYIGKIMLAWLDCILAYFIFLVVRYIIVKVILGRLNTIIDFGDLLSGAGD